MLILTAKAIHLRGDAVEVRGVFDFEGGSIGRGAECDLVLPDPERRISRMQARVSYNNGSYLVINASTSNPMYVNGVELAPGSTKTLSDGDELRAGSYVLAVQSSESGAREADAQGLMAPIEPLVDESVPALATGIASEGIDALIAAPLASLRGASSNPFADLLGAAVSVQGPTYESPAPQAQHAPGGLDEVLVAPKMAYESSPANASTSSGSTTPGLTNVTSAENLRELPPAGRLDPADPFADLLSEATPLSHGRGQQAKSQDELLAGLSAPASTPSLAPGIRTADAIPDPFAILPLKEVRDGVDARRGDDSISRLAGDPFADLMGAPVQAQMASIESSDAGTPKASANYIPHDFNPMALRSLSDRNSADPLSALGRGARGLEDILPHSSIDSIFDPRSESPTALTVDPLSAESSQVMQLNESVDPLRLFDGQSADFLGDSVRLEHERSAQNHAREMAAFFRPPAAIAEDARASQQAESLPLAADAISGPLTNPGTQPALASVDDEVEPVVAESMQPASPLPGQGVAEPLVRVQASEGVPPPPVVEAHYMARDVQSSQLTPSVATQQLTKPSGDVSGSAAAAWIAAFQKGAGLESLPAHVITPELMETVGRMMSIAAQGMVDLLAGRAAVKQEVHLSVTLINPRSNNPLKFLPDGHTALLQMLGPRMPGFMSATQAMEEAVQDLVTHQSAIAAGTQATIEALFRRFDPVAIETDHPQLGMGEKMSKTIHHARLWGVYLAQYRQIRDEVKNSFFKRLGAEFQDAYNKEYGRDRGEDV